MLWEGHLKSSLLMQPDWYCGGLNCHTILVLKPREMLKWVKVTQSCLTLFNPMNNTVCGILQARRLEWVAFPFSKGSSQPSDWTQVSHITGGFFTQWATREALRCWSQMKMSWNLIQNSQTVFFKTQCLTKVLTVPHTWKGLLEFSCSVILDSLWPHRLQHPRPPCPSLSPRVCSNSCLFIQ